MVRSRVKPGMKMGLSSWRHVVPITPQGESRGQACLSMTEPLAELSEGQLGSINTALDPIPYRCAPGLKAAPGFRVTGERSRVKPGMTAQRRPGQRMVRSRGKPGMTAQRRPGQCKVRSRVKPGMTAEGDRDDSTTEAGTMQGEVLGQARDDSGRGPG